MSLQIAAKHLAAKGRGPDTTLVHMTNKEVQGLQALAEKNGGSLSINPDTGLPEAGFLESILPVVAGVGLTAAGMGPMAAALTVGGVSALSTGSLSKGLFAGLGAYGGASLGGQLAAQGMTEAAAANASFGDRLASMGQNASFENIGNFISANPKTAMAGIAGPLLSSMEDENQNDKPSEPVGDADPGARARSGIKFNPGYMTPTPLPNPYGIEQTYATPYYGAEGGVAHMAEGGSTSEPIDTRTQFADYLKKVMNPTNRTNAVSGSTNPYEWWKSTGTPEAKPAEPPAETAEEYAARMSLNARGGGGGRGEKPEPSAWDSMTDTEKTEYYAQRPFESKMADMAGTYLSKGFLFGALGKAQDAITPGFTDRNLNILRGTHPPADSPLAGGPLVYSKEAGTEPAGGPIDYGPESGYMTNTDPYFSTQLGPGVGASTLSLPTSQDAVAQTNAALGYTFKPDAIRDMLANSALPESNKIVDKYLADNAAAIAPTQFEGIVSAADLGSPFPGPTKTTTQKQADRIRALAQASPFSPSISNSYLTPGYVHDPARYQKELENQLDQLNQLPDESPNKTENINFVQSSLDRLKNTYTQQENAFKADQLMRANVEMFGPVNYSAADEADRMFAAPDIMGINEIKAEADPNADNSAQILKAFDPNNADVAGLLSEPGFQLAAGADYTGGISDGSTLAGIPAPNVGYGQGRGAFGIGGVWTNREGVPITTRDGSPVMTGAGAEAMQRAVAESNAAANRTYGNAPEGRTGRDATAGDGNDRSQYGSVAAGYTGGSEAADGGLSTPYGFQHMAQGGISDPYNLGSYSDGGRLLKGPGDGVSDSIPATIGKGRPARLADGEFVIPARIVSEIGNGSTEAGARKLYAMMDRIQASRRNTVGKGKVAVNNRADKYLPA